MKKLIMILTVAVYVWSNGMVKAQDYQNIPTWFDSVKLGVMVHYGLYSIPSYSGKEQYAEWFYKGLISGDTARIDFQKRVFGDDFSYFDYMQLFKAEMFNADSWVQLFEKAGAKYTLFSSKHHDGFCLWDTKTTDKNSMNTPAHKDFLKELKQACEKHNIRFGLYYSLMEWDNPYFRWTIDTAGLEQYVDKYLLVQFKELVDMYKPSVVFADGDWDFDYRKLRSSEMIDYLIKTVGKDEAVVNNRWGIGNPYGFLTPEYSAGLKEENRTWSECRSLSRSFGLNRNADLESYLSAKELIKHFVQLVSMGGGLMLNVAPAADGMIPLLQQERLLQLGRFLATNGEAVYGSKPYRTKYKGLQSSDYIYSKTLDFDWVRNAPVKKCSEDDFSIDWRNDFTPEKDETIHFLLDADDEAEIVISHSNKVLYEGKTTKDGDLRFAFDFKKGIRYDIEVKYYEKDVDAHLRLLREDADKNTVAFSTGKDWTGKVQWYDSDLFFTANNNNLYVIRTSDEGAVLQFPLDKAPDKNMKITLLGNEDTPIIWRYDGKHLIMDFRNLTPNAITSEYAHVFRLEGYLK